MGYKTTIDYIYDISLEAISFGLLPHTNAGIITFLEMKKLSSVNASMGLMLESINPNLKVHKKSPGKNPKKRLKVIENAGKLKIPFTTGILIGIGESKKDITMSLKKIATLHRKYHHIQEVIIQNYSEGKKKEIRLKEPTVKQMITIIKQARKILPKDIAIQIPPNLIEIDKLIKHGINDIGGISPISIDYINPQKNWPSIEKIKEIIENKNYNLKERLTIYPKYIQKKWYSKILHNIITNLNTKINKTIRD